jgi:hypothetical protein
MKNAGIVAGFARSRRFRIPSGTARPISIFEDGVVSQFGRHLHLYEIFFKTYSEEVGGIHCRNIGAECPGQLAWLV